MTISRKHLAAAFFAKIQITKELQKKEKSHNKHGVFQKITQGFCAKEHYPQVDRPKGCRASSVSKQG